MCAKLTGKFKLNSGCNGCKYQFFKPSPAYGGLIEGCSRTDWKGVKTIHDCHNCESIESPEVDKEQEKQKLVIEEN